MMSVVARILVKSYAIHATPIRRYAAASGYAIAAEAPLAIAMLRYASAMAADVDGCYADIAIAPHCCYSDALRRYYAMATISLPLRLMT